MTAILIVLAGAYGVHLLTTALMLGWDGVAPGPRDSLHRSVRRDAFRRWLVEAGLADVATHEFLGVVAVLALGGGLLGLVVFGAPLPALVLAGFAGTFPVASYRSQRRRRLERAAQAWPRLIEEIRVLTASAGRSVPQALFDAGRRAPDELRVAFDAAHREWLLSTDFRRTVEVLKSLLADPTADAACETLLVAHEVGGTDLDQRLSALASDRAADVSARKDAEARQAGARFARRFVLLVPLGMAAAGLSVGTGRHSYQTAGGQLLVTVGLALVIGCWVWAGHIMRLPDDDRVFDR